MSDPKRHTNLLESLDKIQRIAELQAANVQRSEPLAAAEKVSLEIEGLKQRVKEATETHDLRKEYLPKLFWLIVVWLALVVAFVFATSIGLITLSDSVLIAFITSTTVSVLGLFMLAGRWLFPSSQKD